MVSGHCVTSVIRHAVLSPLPRRVPTGLQKQHPCTLYVLGHAFTRPPLPQHPIPLARHLVSPPPLRPLVCPVLCRAPWSTRLHLAFATPLPRPHQRRRALAPCPKPSELSALRPLSRAPARQPPLGCLPPLPASHGLPRCSPASVARPRGPSLSLSCQQDKWEDVPVCDWAYT